MAARAMNARYGLFGMVVAAARTAVHAYVPIVFLANRTYFCKVGSMVTDMNRTF